MSPFSTGGPVDACDKRRVSVMGVTNVVVTNVVVTNDYVTTMSWRHKKNI